MSRTVVINLGTGNLNQGFPYVTVRLWTDPYPQAEQFVGSLPAAPELLESYRIWQSTYRALCGRLVLRLPTDEALEDELEIEPGGITQVSQLTFQEFGEQLQQQINTWLNSEGFLILERQLRSHLNPSDEIRVIVEANDDLLRRLPWHCWDFFQTYPYAEVGLSRPEYKRQKTVRKQDGRKKVRILAILGDLRGIDVAAERQFLQALTDAEVAFLVAPSRQELNQQLWDAIGWDVLFFAGHSQTEAETGRIYINENPTNHSLTIEQLEEALDTAIKNDLKLAIFNSCDGVGLAEALGKLQIPQVIVMREPVPNQVAKDFLKYFLEAFAVERLPLYQAMRQARRKLQGLEDAFPAASWLPVLCQNPSTEPPTWLQLGGIAPCPYRGLFAFQEADAHLFFGREQVIDDLIRAVKRKTLVSIVGASGSGKSSVVFAGLVPRLRRIAGSTRWQVISFRPGIKPFDTLAEAFAECQTQGNETASGQRRFSLISDRSGSSLLELSADLQQDQQSLCRMIERLQQIIPSSRLLLIVDQFEELYTLCPEADRQLFLDGLLNAVESAPAFTLLLTLRADFYGYALSDRRLSDALQNAVYNLGPMSRAELQTTIVEPAAQMQVKLESGLTDKLIQATWGHAGRLPLLEFALTELWSQQQAGWLTHQAYDAIGGVEEALANHAEMVYARVHRTDQQRMQRIFMQLVEPGAGTDSSRRLATRDDVGDDNWDLVSHLASSRLVVTSRNEVTGEETVEVVHEALIRNWERLEHWLQINGEFRRWQEDLRRARRLWEESDRDADMLLRGKLLVDAEHWYRDRQNELASKEQQFIQLSLLQRDRALKQRSRRRKLIFSSLIAGFLIALLLTAGAIWGWQTSAINEVNSITASSKALFASQKRFDALIEAIRANQKLKRLVGADSNTQAEALEALQQAVYRVVEVNRLMSESKENVWSVAISPDSQLIAAASHDKTVHLWSQNGQEVKTLKGHTDRVWGVAFSPDNQMIASASEDKTVRLWSRSGQLLHILKGHQDAVWTVAISPDSQTIASGSNDGTVRLWSRTGQMLQVLKGHPRPVWGVAFSPDGQLIGSTSDDGTVKLWDRSGKERYSFKGPVTLGIAFSPNSQQIATANDDGTVTLWNREGQKLGTLVGHSDAVSQVKFSPNGRVLATASRDTTIKLWRPNGDLLATLTGHSRRVQGVAFSEDGQLLVSGGEDVIVRLWRLNNTLLKVLVGHRKPVIATAFSPNGQWVASAADDSSVKLWNRSGGLVRTLPLPQQTGALGITFSPDSQMMVAGSADGRISFWSLDGTLLRSFKGHEMYVWHVAFSPDGRTIASASADQTIKLWTVEGKLLHTFNGHRGEVREVRFSPDGQLLASGSVDGTVKLWQPDGTLLKTFSGHEGGVLGLAFSPDGQKIVSGASDKLVKLWTLDGTLLMTLQGHEEQVRGVTFSPNNQMIASASADGTVKLWDQNGNLLNTLRGHSSAVWKVAFSPDGQTIASSGEDKILILWNVDRVRLLNPLTFGCHWVRDYLQTNPSLSPRDRALCKGVPT